MTAVGLDWTDRAAVAAWARDVRAQVDDVIAVGLDLTAPPAERELGPKAARRTVLEAQQKIRDAWRFAGLDEEHETPPPASGRRRGDP